MKAAVQSRPPVTGGPALFLCFLAAACAPTQPEGAAIPPGVWGARGIHLEVTSSGGTVEYDCAHGGIAEPLALDDQGRFAARGTHIREHGGPVQEGEEPRAEPARYEGRVRRDTMTLTVALTASSERLGPFQLQRGERGRLVKCL